MLAAVVSMLDAGKLHLTEECFHQTINLFDAEIQIMTPHTTDTTDTPTQLGYAELGCAHHA